MRVIPYVSSVVSITSFLLVIRSSLFLLRHRKLYDSFQPGFEKVLNKVTITHVDIERNSSVYIGF